MTDFGIARSSGDVTWTQVGTVVGTPAYVAPEVTAGQRATALADIYAIGVLLYFMLTAHTPFESENPIAEVVRSQQEDPQPPSVLAPVPAWLDAVVLRAMARKPEHRYQSAAALAADLASNQAPTAQANDDATGTMVLKLPDKPVAPKRRGGIRLFLGVVAAALLVGLAGGAAVFGQQYLQKTTANATATARTSPTSAASPPAGKNLLANSELISLGGAQPADWQPQVFQSKPGYRYYWINDGPGGHELRWDAPNSVDVAWTGSPVPIQPGWKLNLSGFIKVTDVPSDGPGAALHLVCHAADGHETGASATAGKTGRTGWEEVQVALTVPKDSSTCQAQLRLGDAGRPTTGMAEFSKIALVQT